MAKKINLEELQQTAQTLKNYIDSATKDIANLFTHEQTETLYTLKCNGIVIATIPISNTSYIVSNNLTYCTNNNSSIEVTEGNSYTATITANSEYKLDSVTVIMGGTDITSAVYADGVINIPTVNGNISITASAVSLYAVAGSIDENNNITLTGLPAGTYTLKYEDANGPLSSFSDIATVEVV